MTNLDLITVGLVLAGAIIMLVSILSAGRILAYGRGLRAQKAWTFLRSLMLLFFVGYVVTILLVLMKQVHYLPPLVGFVFFFGALFVYLVERVCLSNIQQEKLLTEKAMSMAQEMKRISETTCHHLQEPLRQVASFLQLAQRKCEGNLDSETKGHINMAVDGAVWMKHLLSDLGDYERLGNAAPRQEMVDSQDCLRLALQPLQGKIEALGAKITADSLPTIYADKRQFIRLLQDLVGNGLKFHGNAPPTIGVSAARLESEWLFEVCDNGLGIAKEYHERIFKLFEKLHNRTQYAGTGMGLAICKRIVVKHGGTIGVDSQIDKGSTFWFTIPIPRES